MTRDPPSRAAAPLAGASSDRADARAEAAPLLRVTDLVVDYSRATLGLGRSAERRVAVDGVSFSLERGRTLGLVGNSGCGKSSLALAVLGLTKARSGRVWFDGLELNLRSERAWRPLRRRLQVVFQDQWSALDPRQRVGAALREPMALHGIGGGRGERDERAAQLLREVGLAPDLLRRLPYELSGGERQRVAIARALAVGPELLICDEAVSSLDAVARAQVLDLLGELCHRRGLACLFISHDLGVIEAVADEVAVMADGRIVEFGACERICQAAASAAGRALMAARLR